jgi:T-complex protein 1 subunit gamma
MIELSRSQDEEVGDGTTSVIILAGEVMMKAGPFINNNLHPTVIVQGYNKALQEALLICERYVRLLAFLPCFRELNRMKTNFCNSPLYTVTHFLAKHW